MTFQEAAKQFRALALDAKFYDSTPGGRRRCTDPHARAEAWGIFIDSLCKEGKITQKQYESWGFPWDHNA